MPQYRYCDENSGSDKVVGKLKRWLRSPEAEFVGGGGASSRASAVFQPLEVVPGGLGVGPLEGH